MAQDLMFTSTPYSTNAVYRHAKLCNVLFARELARRVKGGPLTILKIEIQNWYNLKLSVVMQDEIH